MPKQQALSARLQKFYNTSPMREGILCWYPFESNSAVLDMSGGALTDLLHRQCAHVVSSDGFINDSKETFDYAIALDPDDFSVEYLAQLKNKLKPHGKLLLAYENPFALRYWSGKRSPKRKIPYDSLFGKDGRPSAAELKIRLKLAGFEGQKWYYPLTDHWFAQEVYSENYLPDQYLNQRFIPYTADDDALRFIEQGLYREVIRGGAFEFMCGAYLVEARVSGQDLACSVDYAAVTAYREPPKRFMTIVRNDGIVIKTPLHPDGKQSVTNMISNHQHLAELGVDVVPLGLDGDSIIMPRLEHLTLWDYWVKKLADGSFDEDEMFSQFDRIREAILKAAASGKCFWELVPANCFYDEIGDKLIFFDQEYFWDGVTPDVAIARAVWSLNYSPAFSSDSRSKIWLERLKERYGIAERWQELSESADAKAYKEVFGEGMNELNAETEKALKRVAENLCAMR